MSKQEYSFYIVLRGVTSLLELAALFTLFYVYFSNGNPVTGATALGFLVGSLLANSGNGPFIRYALSKLQNKYP